MSRKWFNLEGQTDDAVFGGETSAYSSLGLTRSQRLGGFGACFVGGLGVSLLGAIMLFLGATGAFARRALFAVGGILSLVGHTLRSLFPLMTRYRPLRIALALSEYVLIGRALFAVGGILSLVGTGFLVGFSKQLKTMFKPVRVVATILLFGSIVMTFVSAFILPAILCIVFVIVQYLAYLWYSLSYIPYARTLVKSWFGY